MLFPTLTHIFFQSGQPHNLSELFLITKFLRDVDESCFEHYQPKTIAGGSNKTFVWIGHTQFPNRLLPLRLGLSDKESHVCRKVSPRRFPNME